MSNALNIVGQRKGTPMAHRFLQSFGATSLLVNGVLYFAFRSSAKFHGGIQLGLAIIGGVCFAASFYVRVTGENSSNG